MTDKNLTEIVAIIDRSGSMMSLTKETIGGFNSFLDEQKKTTGKAKLTLVQFDDQYQIDQDGVDINDAKPLDENTYIPRGYTSLCDAVGKTIITVGERLSKTPEEERPGQVIFLVITDGAENSSKEYTADKIAKMVKHQTETYSWIFTFLGGGDAKFQKAQGASLGFNSNNTYNYSASSGGTERLYGNLSRGISRKREDCVKGVSVNCDAALLTLEEQKEITEDK
jgi:uncharacterized protein YegL